MNIPEYHELVVVGAGAAGLSAAAAASDGGVGDVVLIEKHYQPGGRLLSEKNKQSGSRLFGEALGNEKLLERFLRFLIEYEVPVRCGLELLDIDTDSDGFVLRLEDEQGLPLELHCRGLILSTGDNEAVRESLPEFVAELKKEGAALYFQTAGELIESCELPDEAAENGAQAGREAAEYLLKHREL